MNKKELIAQLHKVRAGVRPSATWQRSYRSTLLAQISAQTNARMPKTFREKAIAYLRPFAMLARPVAAIVFTLAVGFGASLASVDATRNSLPGDIFYPLKLTAERVQVNMAANKEEKTALEIVFAERRLQEFTKISTEPARKEASRLPLKKYQENIASVKSNLEQIKIENPKRAAEIAELVDKKTEEYVAILKESKGVQKPEQASVQEAIEKSKGVNEAAVNVIIAENSGQGSATESYAKFLNRIAERIPKIQAETVELRSRLDKLRADGVAAIPGPVVEGQEQKQIALTELYGRLDRVRELLATATLRVTQQNAEDAHAQSKQAQEMVDAIDKILDALDEQIAAERAAAEQAGTEEHETEDTQG